MKLKSIYILALLLTNIFTVDAQENCMNLVWSDEFNYSGLPDANKWSYDVGGDGWGNNEAQYYTENRTENARVENGQLVIEARKESFAGKKYTSARLISKDKGDWLYGRFEIKAKLPQGKGTWPAIWMLPTDWEYGGWPASGEIDIMEHVGYDPSVVHGTIHTQAYHHSIGTQKAGTINISDFNTAFHVYAIEWNEDEIIWYVDDQEYFRFKNENKTYKEWPFDKRFHLLLNLAIGGNWGGVEGIDDSIFPQKMEVDYVRVYGYNPEVKIWGSDFLKNEEETTFETNVKDANTFDWTFPEGVEILEGENTASVKVRWGKKGGVIKLELTTDCETYTVEKSVQGYTQPEGDTYLITPQDEQGNIRWEAIVKEGNTIELTKEAEGSIRVDFDITAPRENPYLSLKLSDLLDLSTYRKLSIPLKATGAPDNIRLDLYDVNGKYNANNIFETYDIVEGDKFYDYIHFYGVEGKETTNFSLDQIAELRFYFNYSFLAEAQSGTFWLNPITCSIPAEGEDQTDPEPPTDEDDDDKITDIEDDVLQDVSVYPIPAKSEIYIKNLKGTASLQFVDLMGRQYSLQHEAFGEVRRVLLPKNLQGIYFMTVTTEEGYTKTFKILLED